MSMIYEDDKIIIYWGSASDGLLVDAEFYSRYCSAPVIKSPPFSSIACKLHAQKMIFARQVHGTEGIIIKCCGQEVMAFEIPADFSVTNQKNIALAVLTADCLPIVLVDPIHHAIALIHAGWRGSVTSIAVRAIEALIQEFGTQVRDVQVFFGPCALPCCYSVGDEVIQAIEKQYLRALTSVGGATYFDLIEYNSLKLIEAGVLPASVDKSYAVCTICDHRFWSYRRQQKMAGRNITAVVLK